MDSRSKSARNPGVSSSSSVPEQYARLKIHTDEVESSSGPATTSTTASAIAKFKNEFGGGSGVDAGAAPQGQPPINPNALDIDDYEAMLNQGVVDQSVVEMLMANNNISLTGDGTGARTKSGRKLSLASSYNSFMNSTNNRLGLGIEIVGGMSPAASSAMKTVVEGKRKLKQQGFRAESPEKLPKYTSLFVSPEPNAAGFGNAENEDDENDATATGRPNALGDEDASIDDDIASDTIEDVDFATPSAMGARRGQHSGFGAANRGDGASGDREAGDGDAGGGGKHRRADGRGGHTHTRSASSRLRPLRSSRPRLPSLDEHGATRPGDSAVAATGAGGGAGNDATVPSARATRVRSARPGLSVSYQRFQQQLQSSMSRAAVVAGGADDAGRTTTRRPLDEMEANFAASSGIRQPGGAAIAFGHLHHHHHQQQQQQQQQQTIDITGAATRRAAGIYEDDGDDDADSVISVPSLHVNFLNAKHQKKKKDVPEVPEWLLLLRKLQEQGDEGKFVYLKRNYRTTNVYDLRVVSRDDVYAKQNDAAAEGAPGGGGGTATHFRRRIQSSRPTAGGRSRNQSGVSAVSSAGRRSAVGEPKGNRLLSGRRFGSGAGSSMMHGRSFEDEYYTMSSSGITHYYKGSISFTSSFDFVKEFKSFSALRTLRTFRTFRVKKSFTMWRSGVRKIKMREQQERLTSRSDGLLLLDEHLFGFITRIVGLCHKLTRLYHIDDHQHLHESLTNTTNKGEADNADDDGTFRVRVVVPHDNNNADERASTRPQFYKSSATTHAEDDQKQQQEAAAATSPWERRLFTLDDFVSFQQRFSSGAQDDARRIMNAIHDAVVEACELAPTEIDKAKYDATSSTRPAPASSAFKSKRPAETPAVAVTPSVAATKDTHVAEAGGTGAAKSGAMNIGNTNDGDMNHNNTTGAVKNDERGISRSNSTVLVEDLSTQSAGVGASTSQTSLHVVVPDDPVLSPVLMTPNGKQAGGVSTTAAMASAAGIGSPNAAFPQTVAAAHRLKRRRLWRFVRLIDLLLSQSLGTSVTLTVKKLHAMLHSGTHVDDTLDDVFVLEDTVGLGRFPMPVTAISGPVVPRSDSRQHYHSDYGCVSQDMGAATTAHSDAREEKTTVPAVIALRRTEPMLKVVLDIVDANVDPHAGQGDSAVGAQGRSPRIRNRTRTNSKLARQNSSSAGTIGRRGSGGTTTAVVIPKLHMLPSRQAVVKSLMLLVQRTQNWYGETERIIVSEEILRHVEPAISVGFINSVSSKPNDDANKLSESDLSLVAEYDDEFASNPGGSSSNSTFQYTLAHCPSTYVEKRRQDAQLKLLIDLVDEAFRELDAKASEAVPVLERVYAEFGRQRKCCQLLDADMAKYKKLSNTSSPSAASPSSGTVNTQTTPRSRRTSSLKEANGNAHRKEGAKKKEDSALKLLLLNEVLLRREFGDITLLVASQHQQQQQQQQRKPSSAKPPSSAKSPGGAGINTLDEFDEVAEQHYELERNKLDELRDTVHMMRDQLKVLHVLPDSVCDSGNIIKLQYDLVKSLLPVAKGKLDELLDRIPMCCDVRYDTFMSILSSFSSVFSHTPSRSDDFAELLESLDCYKRCHKMMQIKYNDVIGMVHLCEDLNIRLTTLQDAHFTSLPTEMARLKGLVDAVEASLPSYTKKFEEELTEESEAVLKESRELWLSAQNKEVLDEKSDPKEQLAKMVKIRSGIERLINRSRDINSKQRRFQVEATQMEEVEELHREVVSRHTLWESHVGWHDNVNNWSEATLEELDVGAMGSELSRMTGVATRLEHSLPENKVVDNLKGVLGDWSGHIKILRALEMSQLRHHHWAVIKTAMELGRVEDQLVVDSEKGIKGIKLKTLLMSGLGKHKEAIHEVTAKATAEATLERVLASMKVKWSNKDLPVANYVMSKNSSAVTAGMMVLGDTRELQAAVDDSIITLSGFVSNASIQSSPNFGQLLYWLGKLRTLDELLESWTETQNKLLMLEPVLALPDMARHLPQTSNNFMAAERLLHNATHEILSKAQAILAAQNAHVLLQVLKRVSEDLDYVRKSLESYLNGKRDAFARLHFVADNELLSMISGCRSSLATNNLALFGANVNSHINKCFDGVAGLEVIREEGAPVSTISALLSSEGERLSLGKRGVKVRNGLEDWLNALELAMRVEMKANIRQCVYEYLAHCAPPSVDGTCDDKATEGVDDEERIKESEAHDAFAEVEDAEAIRRSEWALSHPSQCALVAARIAWSAAVSECIEDGTSRACAAKYGRYLAASTSVVQRGGLERLERSRCVNLIIADIHCRDVIFRIGTHNVTSVNDFFWTSQLRYAGTGGGSGSTGGSNGGGGDAQGSSSELPLMSVTAQQLSYSMEYGYEYLGSAPRLVITPMTERAFLTMTTALSMGLGANPTGPAGTGKTETTKELSRWIAVQCVVFNCGDGLDAKFMGGFFNGLASSGAWACLDEFNRIDVEVLSVVAVQLLTLQQALRARSKTVYIDGPKEVPLVSSAAVFATMNPTYSGRVELPMNMKPLFRPLAMMLPDSAVIAEVTLTSGGFKDARALAKKAVKLYTLAKELLSKQHHYDWGMRALKATLDAASNLKLSIRTTLDSRENDLLAAACSESTVPKLIANDVEIFNGLLFDVFPRSKESSLLQGGPGTSSLSANVKDALSMMGHVSSDALVTKATQLHETLVVRFGVMVVGPPGGGKSAAIDSLARAVTDNETRTVEIIRINPKALKAGELFGEFRHETGEWFDGVASKALRDAMTSESEQSKLLASAAAGGDQAADSGAKFGQALQHDAFASKVQRQSWVVFDGALDPIWCENLNSALDDSRTLCLPNSERVKLSMDRVRILFELDSLEAASPASVSRCGVLFVPAGSVTWRMRYAAWIENSLTPRLHALIGMRKDAGSVADGSVNMSISRGSSRIDEFIEDDEALDRFDDNHDDESDDAGRSNSGIVDAGFGMESEGAYLYDEVEQALTRLCESLTSLMEAHVDDVTNFVENTILEGATLSTTFTKSGFGMLLSLLDAYLVQTFEADETATSGIILDALSSEAFYERAFAFALIWSYGSFISDERKRDAHDD